MKKCLYVLLVCMVGHAAMSQTVQVPTDSVNGNSSQAVVAITAPSITQITNSVLATLADNDKDGLGKAFEQSWTALIGAPTQRFIPHKNNMTYNAWRMEFKASGVVWTATLPYYSCSSQYVFVYRGFKTVCSYAGTSDVSVNLGHATGSNQLTGSVPLYTSMGTDEYGNEGYSYVYGRFAAGPVITTTGDLTGYWWRSNDDDYWYATYNNPSLAVATTQTFPLYFCDPQNACGYNRFGWTYTVSN